mmetsp:Transcript_88297/g.201893  ORF Transcript_88297/g.201893 Transcript_88297/m.201893 type:complete len:225 (+) Transcript_88297:673-1347(+)
MGYGAAGEAVASRSRIEILKDRTNLTLHVGDISYADDSFLHLHTSCPEEFCYEAVYDNYMEWIENVSDTKPYMVAAGNHESECHSPACLVSSEIKESLRNFSAYNARWAMPSLESGGVANMWYSFNFGPVHFVVVNTETDFPDAPEADYGDGGKVRERSSPWSTMCCADHWIEGWAFCPERCLPCLVEHGPAGGLRKPSPATVDCCFRTSTVGVPKRHFQGSRC